CEGDDLAVALGDRLVETWQLPGAVAPTKRDAWLAHRYRLDDRIGLVARRVGRDDDLHAVGWIIEREQVVEAPPDHGLFVVRRHDHRHSRRDLALPHTLGPHPPGHGRRRRIADVRPGERAETAPEERLENDHRREVSRYAGKKPPESAPPVASTRPWYAVSS